MTSPRRWLERSFGRLLAFIWASFLVIAAIIIGHLLTIGAPLPNVSMIFLLAVLLAAIMFGFGPAIYVSLLSFLAYNFFFIEPLYTLSVAAPHELFALLVFLLVAIITSALAGRVRHQVRVAGQRTRAMQRLYEFTRKLSGLARLDDIAEGAAAEVHASLGRPTVVLLGSAGELKLCATWPPEDSLNPNALAAAHQAFTAAENVAPHGHTSPTGDWLFTKLKTARRAVGVIGVAQNANKAPLDGEAHALLATLAEQTAAALERAEFAYEMLRARTAAESERVRNTLLASISHDFRTPLSSILGSATTLLEFRDKFGREQQAELLIQIKQEAEHLDGMVRNLLAMIRIDAGALELRSDWIDLREIGERVVSAARRRGCSQQLEVTFPEKLPLIRADALLVEQALTNVVGNALVHTQSGAKVLVDAIIDPADIVVRVSDDGPGIPGDILPHVFEKFVRASRARPGRGDGSERTGLGLAIAKGIMEAHGGSIRAESPIAKGHGTRMLLSFPFAVETA
jgi:two-component system sensor histidine kinase KdpD